MPMIDSPVANQHKADLIVWSVSFDQPDRAQKVASSASHRTCRRLLMRTSFVSDLSTVPAYSRRCPDWYRRYRSRLLGRRSSAARSLRRLIQSSFAALVENRHAFFESVRRTRYDLTILKGLGAIGIPDCRPNGLLSRFHCLPIRSERKKRPPAVTGPATRW